MDDRNFLYFGCGVQLTSDEDLKELLLKGIDLEESNYLCNYMYPINYSNQHVSCYDIIRSLALNGKNAVIVVKIPKSYFYPELDEDDLPKEIPLPILKQTEDQEKNLTWNLDSDYIYRIYYPHDNNRYFSNPNYNPVCDPVGKQYDDLQLSDFANSFANELFVFGLSRRGKNYDELARSDLANDLWTEVVDNLNKKYKNIDDVSLNLKKDWE